MPQRHSKNNNDHSIFTYHEKRKAGYGSITERFGADSQIPFGYCCIALQPARRPVASPSGHIYSKESILEYLIEQKKKLKRIRQEWDRQQMEDREREALAHEAKEEEALRKFAAANVDVDGGYSAAELKNAEAPDSRALALRALDKSTDHRSLIEKKEEIKRTSFWMPEFTPTAEKRVERPDIRPRSPMSGMPLRAKDLVPLQLEVQEGTGYGSGDGRTRYLCSVSKKQIGAHPCVLLKPSGVVILESIFDELVRPTMRDPIDGSRLKKKDVLRLQRAGSSFAASGNVEVTKQGLAMT